MNFQPSFVTPFNNSENYAKYLLMHYEPGANVLLTVFEWLYKGPTPPEQFLVEYAKNKTYGMNKDEKDKLEKLKSGEIALNQLDFSLLYSLVKLSCDVARRDDPVWGRNCPLHRTKELEHLLYVLKQGRNKLAHPSEAQKNLSDSDVLNHAQEMITLLSSILTLAGERAAIPELEVKKIIDSVEESIENICKDKDALSKVKVKPHLQKLYNEHVAKTSKGVTNWIDDTSKQLQGQIETTGQKLVKNVWGSNMDQDQQENVDKTIKFLSTTVEQAAKNLGQQIQAGENGLQKFFQQDKRNIAETLEQEYDIKLDKAVSNVLKKLF